MKNRANANRAGGMAINWITIFVQILVSLFFIPFFLKTVGDKQYGLYAFSNSLIAWIDTLLIAVGSAYYRFLTREKKNHGEYGEARACGVFFTIFLIIAILMTVLGLGFDSLLYFNVIQLNEYTIAEKNQICLIILMSILSSFISTILTVRKSYYYYKQKYIFVYSVGFAQIVIQTTLSLLFLKLGYGVIAVAAVHFGTAILSSLVLGLFAKLYLKEKVSIAPISEEDKTARKRLFIEILVFSSFVIITTIVDTLNKSLDKTILGFYNANSIANYQLAYTIPSYLISITSIISIVFEKRLNDAYYNGRGIEEVNEVYLRVSNIQTIVTMFIVGGFIACGKEFVFLWLDDTRIQVFYVCCIFMLVYSLTCCNRLALSCRFVQNKHKRAAFIYLAIAIFNVALSLLLVNLVKKEDALWACVAGTAITYIIGHWIVMQIYDKKITKINTTTFFLRYCSYLFVTLTIDLVIIRFFDLVSIDNLIVSFVVKGSLFTVIYLAIAYFVNRKPAKELQARIINYLSSRKKN